MSLPLDGILLYLFEREAHGSINEISIPGAIPDKALLQHARLPLWRLNDRQPNWYYACSFARWSGPIAEGSDHWNKRFDQSLAHLVDFGGRRGKISLSSDRFRSYHMPVFYVHAPKLVWFAVGNGGHIKRLLQSCTNIGKKTSQGWGAVLKWEVEPWHSDWSVESPMGLMRAVPAESGPLQGFRPPYWLRKNQTACRMPKSFVYRA